MLASGKRHALAALRTWTCAFVAMGVVGVGTAHAGTLPPGWKYYKPRLLPSTGDYCFTLFQGYGDCYTNTLWNGYEGKYVSEEEAYPTAFGLRYMLRARADAPGDWEQFVLFYHYNAANPSSSYWALISAQNRKFVTAELGNDYQNTPLAGVLRARASTVGAWEKFDLAIAPDFAHIALRTRSKHKFVSIEYGDTDLLHAMLRARNATVGVWEIFDIY